MNTATENLSNVDVDYDAPERFVHDVPEGFYSPKTKMTAKLRKSITRGTWKNVAEPKAPIANAIKTARKLAALPLAKVIRRLKQTARRAATSRNLLGQLSPVSFFRPNLEREQDRQLSILRQIVAEIQYREERARV